MPGVMGQTMGQIDPGLQRQWNDFFRNAWNEINATGTTSSPEVQLMIPRRFGPDERRLVQTSYEEHFLGGVDGGFSQQEVARNSVSYLANANMAGAVGNLIGGVIARKRADDQAAVQWRPSSNGDVVVTQYGMYMFYRNESMTQGKDTWWVPCNLPPQPLDYASFESAQLTAWDRLETTGMNMDGEPSTNAFITPVASLIFALWCRAMYPDHPQASEVVAGWG